MLSLVFLWYYRFDKDTGLPVAVILLLFIAKVAAGVFNAYIHYHTVVSNDIGFFHWQAVNELKAMHLNPGAFFYEWLLNWGDIRNGLDFSSPKCNVFWKDLGVLVHTKYMTFANILSLGNQYVNVILYNIPFFAGQLLLYKTFYLHQPEKKWLFVIAVFLIPSVLFWCSGMHKDGWVLAAFGIIIYGLDRFITTSGKKYLILLGFGLFFIFIVRYFYLFTLLPLLFLWVWTRRRKHVFVYFFVSLLCTAVVFFQVHRIVPRINPMKMIQDRQQEFFMNIGYSDMKTPKLENHIGSYIENFPTAINHIFLQPKWSSDTPVKYRFATIDNYLVFALFLVFIVHVKRRQTSNPMYLTLLLYGLSIYLFIGYTIPNCGALVRYKSEFTVLIMASLVALSELPRVNQFLNSRLPGAK